MQDPDGRPVPMFDRDTGAIDPDVAAYWHDNFDISYRLAHNWAALKTDLECKIHVIIGSVDTYYLDGSARRLKAVLDGLRAKGQVTFLEERTHNDLNPVGEDPYGLEKQIAKAFRTRGRCQLQPSCPAKL